MPRYPTIPLVPAGRAAASESRRTALRLMAASAALAAGGCKGPPQTEILPYVAMPEQLVPGQPLFYASTFVRRGLAHGVLVESNMGRPTKVEGNPLHPATLGASDVFMQASILQMWDPDRSQTVWGSGAVSTWRAFETMLVPLRARWQQDGGAGLRILTGPASSPLLAAQLLALFARYPNARWHSYDPLQDERDAQAARLAFGRPADVLLQCERATAVVSFDADIIGGDWPGAIANARQLVQGRNSTATGFTRRLFSVEATPGLFGAMADNRLALAPADIDYLVARVAARFALTPAPAARTDPRLAGWEARLAAVLAQNQGRSLVVGGGSLSAPSRALVHLLNARLGNAGRTVIYIDPVRLLPGGAPGSIGALAADMQAGAVGTLVMIGANPVYNAPADIGFAALLKRVPLAIHLGLYRDETARRSHWHLPRSHDYERWSDARAFDGTASIVQPLIAPLYDSRSEHQLVALLADDPERNDYARLRRFWSARVGAFDFNGFWQRALGRGIIDGSAASPLVLPTAATLAPRPAPPPVRTGLLPLFVPDMRMDDGEFANNGWLQELPHPLTKLTWDNAALLAPATARRLGLEPGDVVRLALGQEAGQGNAVEAPVWILPGHADDCITLPLGFGRSAAGRVGDGVGFDAYRLRTAAAATGQATLAVTKTGRRHQFAPIQGNDRMEGRELVRVVGVDAFRRDPRVATAAPSARTPEQNLYPQYDYSHYRWGMAIDLNSCIGCGACTIACQAENNIPVVGKEQVRRERAMHWIRVDRYYQGPRERPRTLFQPVPCMHCEYAPCEEVCPVGATVHDSEGLNVQVYNRCVGTRFCSNNCPYKVRRFNFLQFSDQHTETYKAMRNPDVTVRQRGVMEKCNYCLQRITRGRLDAERLGRRIADGEVITACQAACPTGAIVFGDLNDPASRVNRAKASPLDYALLAELNTRPRTSYAARVLNPDPELP
ncbi:4Fe-4S dicluster domain-containing protein [Massilia horti]|nr:4Fe-4S dicluster domain-containing protein [Massilia horti]